MANDCYWWHLEIGFGTDQFEDDGHKCFAPKEQTEALLTWHNEKYGTIQDRLARESDGETMRFGYVDGEWKEIEEMDDKEFRVKDKVTIVDNAIYAEKISPIIEGVVCTVSSKKFPSSPIGVEYEHKLSTRFFHKDGSNINPKCHLYHGHNLKVTVEEKKPVRTIERWVFLYINNEREDIQVIKKLNSKRDCLDAIEVTRKFENCMVLTDPFKVEIPE